MSLIKHHKYTTDVYFKDSALAGDIKITFGIRPLL